MSTITAGDYAVELKIDGDEYRRWYNNEYRKPGGDFENNVAPAMSLKRHIAEKVEEALTGDLKRSTLHEGDTSGVKSHKKRDAEELSAVHVADIVFSFRNSALILALRKRGGFIAR